MFGPIHNDFAIKMSRYIKPHTTGWKPVLGDLESVFVCSTVKYIARE